eukprot:6081951-Pleurochrysis_carterae.AAC.3
MQCPLVSEVNRSKSKKTLCTLTHRALSLDPAAAACGASTTCPRRPVEKPLPILCKGGDRPCSLPRYMFCRQLSHPMRNVYGKSPRIRPYKASHCYAFQLSAIYI